ncbi:MAG TPA: glycosyltransferase family 4 protein [Candidatus Acidoferrales bacterium]|nr:glycosyltransferase family 4 protein [Candidatus Acidoferrales bacterium]
MTAGATIRVLHFSNATTRAGAEEHMLTLLRGFDRQRFRPYLACPNALAKRLDRDLPADVELFGLSFFTPYQPEAAWRLGRLLHELRIDVLHSHMFRASLCASPIGRLCRVPAIIETPHVRENWRRGWKSSYWIDRLAGRAVDAYVAVSQANADYLVRKKGLPARKVRVIRNGCDLARFDPRRPAPAGLRQSLGFAQSDPVLVAVGRLEPQKGHHTLLGAMTLVRRAFPRARLVCVGDGSLRAELENQARALGLGDAVRMVGFQAGVEDWLALADLTVLPSLYEGLPLAAIESLAAGRAVVATAVDGTPEAIVDGETGLTTPAGEPAALARAILRLLENPTLRLELAAAGRAWAVERFSHSRQVRETEQLYRRIWEARRQPRGETSAAAASAPERQTIGMP